MSETPDDIAKEAWNVAGHIYDPTASKAAHEYVAGLIASALLAEREAQKERDAVIADFWETPPEERAQYSHGHHYVAGLDDAGERIAAAIRNAP
jgi:hypothetical protein